MVGSGTHKKVLIDQNTDEGEEPEQADKDENKDNRPASRNSKLRSNTQNSGANVSKNQQAQYRQQVNNFFQFGGGTIHPGNPNMTSKNFFPMKMQN